MKRILITGKDSYIGTSVEKWLLREPGKYLIDTIDMRTDAWKEHDFAKYDVVYHVAGIAHVSSSKKMDDLYYKVNRDLAIETAKKAKSAGVKQFIFMSSIIVYGDSAPIGKQKIIYKDTPPNPTNYYGDSKLQAENGILSLSDNLFKVVVLRPPMIYGTGCKGNYSALSKAAVKLSVFPYIHNSRSMLYIGNLVCFIQLIIDNNEQGVFWPQNSEYSNTSEMFCEIAAAHNKKVIMIKGLSWLLKIISRFSTVINKVFGNLTYDKAMSAYDKDYCKYSRKMSIYLSEGINND